MMPAISVCRTEARIRVGADEAPPVRENSPVLTIRDDPVQARPVPIQRRRTMEITRIAKQCVPALVAVSLGFTALAGTAVAGKLDSLLGDWDLNIAKSKFEPSPPMKKYTMKVIDAGANHLLIKSDWIDADGTVGHVEYSTAFDGKPISLIDYPIADTVTDTMVNTTTWKSVWTKHGKVVESELETIAADGKVFREIDQGRDKKGRKYRNRLVFERP
jgi:hypothetical protein